MVKHRRAVSQELAPSTSLRLAAVAIEVYRAGLRGQPSFLRRCGPEATGRAIFMCGGTLLCGVCLASWRLAALERLERLERLAA